MAPILGQAPSQSSDQDRLNSDPPELFFDEAFGLQTAEMDALAAEAALLRGQWNRARDLAAKAYAGGARGQEVVGVYRVATLVLNGGDAVQSGLPKLEALAADAYYRRLGAVITDLRNGALDRASEQIEDLLSARQHDVLVLYFAGQLKMMRGDNSEALRLFTVALQQHPEFAPAMVSTARLLPSAQLQQAIELVHRALSLHQENGAYRRQLAGLYKQAGQEARARQLFKELFGVIPNVRERYLILARRRLLAGQDQAALRQVENTFQLWGSEPDGYLIKAMAAIDLGQQAEVEEAINAYLEANPQDAQAYFAAGMCYLALGWLTEARLAFETSLEKRPAFAHARTNLIIVEQASGQLALAIERLQQVEAAFPRSDNDLLAFISAHLRLARGDLSAYRRLGTEGSNLLSGGGGLRLSLPPLTNEQRQGFALDHNLMLLMFLNRWDNQVIRYADHALQLVENDPVARYFRGLALEAQGQPGLARLDFQAAIQQEPGFLGAFMGLARIRLQMEDLEGALGIYRSVLALDSEFEPAHLGLISTLLGMDRKQAVREALGAAGLIAKRGHTQFMLAQAYRRVGDEETAILVLRKALGTGDSGTWRTQAAELLRRYDQAVGLPTVQSR